jgi:hypothetical protein
MAWKLTRFHKYVEQQLPIVEKSQKQSKTLQTENEAIKIKKGERKRKKEGTEKLHKISVCMVTGPPMQNSLSLCVLTTAL